MTLRPTKPSAPNTTTFLSRIFARDSDPSHMLIAIGTDFVLLDSAAEHFPFE